MNDQQRPPHEDQPTERLPRSAAVPTEPLETDDAATEKIPRSATSAPVVAVASDRLTPEAAAEPEEAVVARPASAVTSQEVAEPEPKEADVSSDTVPPEPEPASESISEENAALVDGSSEQPSEDEPREQSVPAAASSAVAWRRLARMGAPRLTRANVVVTALAVLLGFALSTQISHTQTQGLESLRSSELVGILDTVTQRSQRLSAEQQELERLRDSLTSGQSGAEAAIRDAQQQVDTLGILNGTTQAVGPGLSISIKDPAHKLTSTLLLDLVQELRDAGAEAIQIGSHRVVASTYFADQPGGGMVVDGVPVSLPLTVIAIGDARTLSSALSIPGGVVETARQQGGSVEAQPLERVHVTAVRNPPTPNHARPVTNPT